MSRIKSALELALERSAEVPADPARVAAYELKKQGKKVVADIRSGKDVDIAKYLSQYHGAELAAVRAGMIETILQYITLPVDTADCAKYQVALQVAGALEASFKKMSKILDDLNNFSHQYLEQKNNIIRSLREHFENAAQTHMKQLAPGIAGMRIDVSTIPEFQQELRKAISSHTRQYEPVFAKTRDFIHDTLTSGH